MQSCDVPTRVDDTPGLVWEILLLFSLPWYRHRDDAPLPLYVHPPGLQPAGLSTRWSMEWHSDVMQQQRLPNQFC